MGLWMECIFEYPRICLVYVNEWCYDSRLYQDVCAVVTRGTGKRKGFFNLLDRWDYTAAFVRPHARSVCGRDAVTAALVFGYVERRAALDC